MSLSGSRPATTHRSPCSKRRWTWTSRASARQPRSGALPAGLGIASVEPGFQAVEEPLEGVLELLLIRGGRGDLGDRAREHGVVLGGQERVGGPHPALVLIGIAVRTKGRRAEGKDEEH